MYVNRPQVNGAKFLCNGEVRPWLGKIADVESPIFLEGTETKIVIGNQARMTPAEALEALDAAVAAWNKGKGEWPQMAVSARIAAMEKFVGKLKEKRDNIVNVLMWEICKVRADAEKEFDRTMDYIAATIKAVKQLRTDDTTLLDESGVIAQHHRAPIGALVFPACTPSSCGPLLLPRAGMAGSVIWLCLLVFAGKCMCEGERESVCA